MKRLRSPRAVLVTCALFDLACSSAPPAEHTAASAAKLLSGAPTVLSATLGSAPAVAEWQPGRLDLFYLGTAGTLKHRYSNDSVSWSDEEDLGGSLASAPTAVSWGPGRLDVFAQGTDGFLKHVWFQVGATDRFQWDPLWFRVNSQPAAASWGPGRLDLFYLGAGGEVRHYYYDHGWGPDGDESLGGHATSPPSATSSSVGRVDVVVRNDFGGISHKAYDPHPLWPRSPGWQPWDGVQDAEPTHVAGTPALSSAGDGTLDVFWLERGDGADGAAIQHVRYDGSSWNDIEYAGTMGGLESIAAVSNWHEPRTHLVLSDDTSTQWSQVWIPGTPAPPGLVGATERVGVRTGSRSFTAVAGSDHTYAWDRGSLVPSLGFPYDDVTSTLSLSEFGTRELIALDQSHPDTFGPPMLGVVHYARLPYGTSRAPWAVDAIRVVDHGTCAITLPGITGPMDASATVEGPSAFSDDVNGGFLVALANQLNMSLRDAGAMRRDALYRMQFSQIGVGADPSANSDGFNMDLRYRACESLWFIPGVPPVPGISLDGCADMRTQAAFRLDAVNGYIGAFPVSVYVTGDWPSDAQNQVDHTLRYEVPAGFAEAALEKATVPAVLSSGCDTDSCCKALEPVPGSPNVMLPHAMGSMVSIVAQGIMREEGVAEATADARAITIVQQLDATRVYLMHDAAHDGTCGYALNVRRVNVLPDGIEAVLANASEGVSADASLARYGLLLSGGDANICPIWRPRLSSALQPLYHIGAEP